jgi:hypothetical protein
MNARIRGERKCKNHDGPPLFPFTAPEWQVKSTHSREASDVAWKEMSLERRIGGMGGQGGRGAKTFLSPMGQRFMPLARTALGLQEVYD